MLNKGLISRKKNDWQTPGWLFNELYDEFKFDLDPCPVDPSFDGLSIEWGKVNFCNPPYNKIKKWLIKGIEEWCLGKTIVCLIPARTDTKWFKSYCMQANEIRFITGRLKFSNSKINAPFPSMIVIFNGDKWKDMDTRPKFSLMEKKC